MVGKVFIDPIGSFLAWCREISPPFGRAEPNDMLQFAIPSAIPILLAFQSAYSLGLDLIAGAPVAGLSMGCGRHGDRPAVGLVCVCQAGGSLFWFGVVLILAGILITQYASQSS